MILDSVYGFVIKVFWPLCEARSVTELYGNTVARQTYGVQEISFIVYVLNLKLFCVNIWYCTWGCTEILPAVSSSQTNPAPAVEPTNEVDNSEKVEDLVFEEGRHRFTLRAKTANMLYPHQRVGLEWFWGLHTKGMGGILGDDMGLGKTLQVYVSEINFLCSFVSKDHRT